MIKHAKTPGPIDQIFSDLATKLQRARQYVQGREWDDAEELTREALAEITLINKPAHDRTLCNAQGCGCLCADCKAQRCPAEQWPTKTPASFIAQLARMTLDGEGGFVMENDDAVAALSWAITEARKLTGEAT